ncbi:hypothetical protein KIPB_000960, partial [Kipferlia bialata]
PNSALQEPLLELLSFSALEYDFISTLLSKRQEYVALAAASDSVTEEPTWAEVEQQNAMAQFSNAKVQSQAPRQGKARALDLRESVPVQRPQGGGGIDTFRIAGAATADIVLPEGTEQTSTEQYDSIYVPASTEPHSMERTPLSCFPLWTHGAFPPEVKSLNPMQSQVYNDVFNNSGNVIVAAPTGAGKTMVALLAILREIRESIGIEEEGEGEGEREGEAMARDAFGNMLIVYITPMKALATEITGKFQKSLGYLSGSVMEVTGDTQLSGMELQKVNVMVCTPEKWDVLGRRAVGEDSPLNRQTLLILDEVHLLGTGRGAVIETLVMRTLQHTEITQKPIRIMALSATVPNVNDVAEFLRIPETSRHVFGPEWRPIPLAQRFIGVKDPKATNRKREREMARERDPMAEESAADRKRKERQQRMGEDEVMDSIVLDIVREEVMKGRQCLVFLHSRAGTTNMCQYLMGQDIPGIDNIDPHLKQQRSRIAAKCRNPDLGPLLQEGFGFHNAGLARSDRLNVEKLFRDGALRVLSCTATLAWGVNLPAHTVIIRGTDVYSSEKGGMIDLNILDVQQIFGRAGRPQFQAEGYGVLITKQAKLPQYMRQLLNQAPLESVMISHLTDILNAEIYTY